MKSTLKRWLKTFTLWELLRGLGLTFRAMFRPKVTYHYPDEQKPVSPRFRGMLALRRYENGEERCIACRLCEANCPAVAITIEAAMRPDGSRRATRYDIDAFKCINCGFCEEVCPVDAVVLTNEMHYHISERGENILTKEKLLMIGDTFEKSIARDRAVEELYR